MIQHLIPLAFCFETSFWEDSKKNNEVCNLSERIGSWKRKNKGNLEKTIRIIFFSSQKLSVLYFFEPKVRLLGQTDKEAVFSSYTKSIGDEECEMKV
jgi:hypothetical protein